MFFNKKHQDIEGDVLKKNFRQDFEVEFWSWNFIKILRLNLGRDFLAKFDQDFEVVIW